MKNRFGVKSTVTLCLGLFSYAIFGHDVPVHQAITVNAAESAFNSSSAYASFVQVVASDLSYAGENGITNSIVKGSAFEDNLPTPIDEGGYRSINHFYDPLDTTYGKGLSDIPPDDRKLIAVNSFTWGSKSNSPGLHVIEGTTINQWSWQNARGFEWLGLTAANQSDRQTALASMFRSVGQVMHLLEDDSQPQHVRNEQHLDELPGVFSIFPSPWLSPIEEYGRKHVAQLNYQASVLDWRSAGFTKLEDFWDRHLYNGSATALDNAESVGGADTLGLAEWCNGNFLGARHLFPEYFNPGDVEYYPFPSRDHSTDYSDVQSHPANHAYTFTNEDGTAGKGIYLAKTGDGIHYQHIARVNYLGAKIPGLTGVRYCTIADPLVEKDYHDNFIPKAVEYSAGLLDYFFRGTLGLRVTNNDDGTYGLYIINTSSQDFSGGSFHLFYDNMNGVRTELTGDDFDISGYSGALTPGEATEAFFTPQAYAVSYTLVYQGTVGTASGSASDPVDEGIAIAANGFPACYVPNDNFTNAIEIPSLPYAYSEDTACTTFEDGEPQPCGWIGSTAWFRFTATDTNDIYVDTLDSDYDTVLALYTGDSLGNLVEVACNDDFSGPQSALNFTPVAGTTYSIQAGGYGGETGNLVLKVANSASFCEGQTTNISDLTWHTWPDGVLVGKGASLSGLSSWPDWPENPDINPYVQETIYSTNFCVAVVYDASIHIVFDVPWTGSFAGLFRFYENGLEIWAGSDFWSQDGWLLPGQHVDVTVTHHLVPGSHQFAIEFGGTISDGSIDITPTSPP